LEKREGETREISLKLTYQEGAFHRYYPKISKNGLDWQPIDSAHYTESENKITIATRELPEYVSVKLSIGPDTTWVSAQELVTSSHVQSWVDDLSKHPFITTQQIGQSREGRPITLMKLGTADDQKMIFVLSRQHPPEVTGYLAMQSFVETLAADDSIATAFRQSFNTYIVPLANPDGVDNGHWRHSAGGIDLNRDWVNVNQPEVAAIQKFMEEKVANTEGSFYFGVDFHSTWQDIYYTIDSTSRGNMPGLVPNMIVAMAKELGLDPNIRPNKMDVPSINSSRYFFETFGAEALTYEIGDDTPRDLLKKKGEVSAKELMRLLLELEN
jgi:murein tripeptide amidase MpaA